MDGKEWDLIVNQMIPNSSRANEGWVSRSGEELDLMDNQMIPNWSRANARMAF